jgi:hypothetical protein
VDCRRAQAEFASGLFFRIAGENAFEHLPQAR